MIWIVQNRNRLGSVTPKKSGSAPVCVSLRRPVSVGMTLQESDDVTDDDDDDCSSSSCSNVTSASCVGTTCGPLDMDHCATLRPCHNSGTCLNTPSQSYTCQCPRGLLLSRPTYYLLLFSFCSQSIWLLCNGADSKQSDWLCLVISLHRFNLWNSAQRVLRPCDISNPWTWPRIWPDPNQLPVVCR